MLGNGVIGDYCNVKSNIYISEGEVSFKFIINTKETYVQIILSSNSSLNSSMLVVGLNEGNSLYSIKHWDSANKNLVSRDESGNKQSLKLSQEYNAKIQIKGNLVQLFVNDVELLKTYHPSSEINISFGIQGASECSIYDIKIDNKKPKVFVIMQFTKEYDEIYDEVIKPICIEHGLSVMRADESLNRGSIISEILKEILESSLIIADITPDNANVYYELGYAHASNKETILLCNKDRLKLPFDISSFRTIFYDNSISGNSRVKKQLSKYLDNIFVIR